MQSKATTVTQYLKELPDDRRKAVKAVRDVIRKNLPKGYAEGMQYGMIGYFVPHSVYPDGYHCDPKQPVPFASVASQKNHISIYLMCIYSDPKHQEWFVKAWKAEGKRLDMGKGCVRFRKLEDVPLEVVGEAIRRVPVKDFLAHYEKSLAGMKSRRPTKKKAAKKVATKAAKTSKTKRVSKKPAAKKKTGKATATKKTPKNRTK
ncbi:MAG: DUF1801 domain-containing protein [Phycisphaerales bacterium]